MTDYEKLIHLTRRASPARQRVILRCWRALEEVERPMPSRTGDRALGHILSEMLEFEEWRERK